MRNIKIAIIAAAVSAAPVAAAHSRVDAGTRVPVIAARTINVVHPASRVTAYSARVPAPWAAQDPADALWRSGRTAINDSEWQKAAEIFQRIHSESAYKTSTYRGQAYYWEAYARVQLGGATQLRQARTLLQTMKSDFPDDAKNVRDASSLLASVQARLSKDFGDETASVDIRRNATQSTDGCNGANDDDNPRIVALNALMQMDADAAMPILEKVVAKRDACSAGLRAHAMYLIAQKHTPRSADMLLDAIKNDPDSEVRQQAVYWLSQVDGDKALDAVAEILRSSKDEDLQQNALFALSQNKSEKANQMLRDYATRTDIPSDVRGTAIHWLGEGHNASNEAFLKDMFTKIHDEDSQQQIIYAVSQAHTAESGEWLMNIVMDDKQPVDLRNQALYWASQTAAHSGTDGDTGAILNAPKLLALYDKLTSQEMKQQLIYVYSQHHDAVFVDKLMDIAKNDKSVDSRTTAIYWLGQIANKDARVAKFLADLING